MKAVPVLLAGMVLVSACTAGGPLDTSNLSDVLTPVGQEGSTNGQQAAVENSTTDPATVAQAVTPRPPGVPKPRPDTTGGGSTGVETALVPADGAATAEPVQEQTALGAEQPAPRRLSLFERLTAPRSLNANRQAARPTPPAAAATTAATAAAAATTTAASPASPTPAAETTLTPAATATANAGGETTAADTAETAPTPTRRSGFFANLFQSNQAGANRPTTNTNTGRTGVVTRNRSTDSRSRFSWNTAALPGVRSRNSIFGSDIDEEHGSEESIELASVTNRARRGNHGLLLQRDSVKVNCFPPQLVRLLKQAERHFGRTPIVTSGYRTKRHNRLIRGARNSLHVQCKAADIQIKGVSKRRLAKYLRSLPGRGGVGTYCHTKSVHIDIGKKRDWNRRCRRRGKRRS